MQDRYSIVAGESRDTIIALFTLTTLSCGKNRLDALETGHAALSQRTTHQDMMLIIMMTMSDWRTNASQIYIRRTRARAANADFGSPSGSSYFFGFRFSSAFALATFFICCVP